MCDAYWVTGGMWCNIPFTWHTSQLRASVMQHGSRLSPQEIPPVTISLHPSSTSRVSHIWVGGRDVAMAWPGYYKTRKCLSHVFSHYHHNQPKCLNTESVPVLVIKTNKTLNVSQQARLGPGQGWSRWVLAVAPLNGRAELSWVVRSNIWKWNRVMCSASPHQARSCLTTTRPIYHPVGLPPPPPPFQCNALSVLS